jgi:hypothetical protein
MGLFKAKNIAEKVKTELSPHCKRIEIAGSIRRQGLDLRECLNSAYNEIKDRKGVTTNGTFIRE